MAEQSKASNEIKIVTQPKKKRQWTLKFREFDGGIDLIINNESTKNSYGTTVISIFQDETIVFFKTELREMGFIVKDL